MVGMTDYRSNKQELLALHVISVPGKPTVLFHSPSFTLFRISPKVGAILQDYVTGRSIEDLSTTHDVSPNVVSNLLASISQAIQTSAIPEAPSNPQTIRRGLGRLVLNVSNACNLRCKYCYAQGGSYGKKTGFMSKDMVRLALDRVIKFFGEVDTILFFGGEPCLNVGAIRAACEYLDTMYQTKHLPSLPVLGMVTNGTVITDELIRLIVKYKINVTFSLDGPPEVNDLLRVSADGRGTFHRIAQNIRCLQEATRGVQPKKIEATYTRKHVQSNISIADLCRYFRHEFGISDVYIVPVSLPVGSSIAEELGLYDHPLPSSMADTSEEIIATWSSDDPQQFGVIYDYIHRLAKRKYSPSLCSVGAASLTIDADGNIYPCYIIMHDELWMGNTQDPEVFSKPPFITIAYKFASHNKDTIPSCQRCWARVFCHLCFGVLYNLTGSVWETSSYLCDWVRRSAERALVEIAEIQSDPIRWRKFVDNAIQYHPLECSNGLDSRSA